MAPSRRLCPFYPSLVAAICVTIMWTGAAVSAAGQAAPTKLAPPPWKIFVMPTDAQSAAGESAEHIRTALRRSLKDRFIVVESATEAAVVYEVTGRRQSSNAGGLSTRIEGRIRIPPGADNTLSYEATSQFQPSWTIVAELVALDIDKACQRFATESAPREQSSATKTEDQDLGIDVAIVAVASAVVYSTADASSKVVAKLERDDYAFLVTRDPTAGFLNVVLPGSLDEGWIRADAVELRLTQKPREKLFEATPAKPDTAPSIEVTNDTDLELTLVIGGARHTIAPKLTRSINVQAGTFNVVASAPGVRPYVGTETYQSGYVYKVTYYIKRTP